MLIFFSKIKITLYWVLIAGLVGLVCGFYHLTIPVWNGQKIYSPLVLNNQSPSLTFDETIFYATKARESWDGHLGINDPFIFEYKTTPSPYNLGESWPAFLMAILARLSGGIPSSFIVADFVWPPVTFLLLAYWFYRLSKDVVLAPLAAIASMFLAQYFAFFPYVPSIIKMLIQFFSSGGVSDSIRSFHPQISFPFFLIFTILLWQILDQTKTKPKTRLVWLLGLSLGILFYTYIFFWTYALMWLGIIIAGAFLSKKYALVKQLMPAILIAFIIGLPYWLSLWQFYHLPISRSFMQNAQQPSGEAGWLTAADIKQWGFLAFFIILNWTLVKKKWITAFWSKFYLAGAMILMSLKLSGLKAEDMKEHWMIRVVWPLTVIFLILIIGRLLKNFLKKKNIKLLIVGLTLGLLLYQARIHWQYFKIHADLYYLEPQRVEMFKWLNQNTPKDSVVLTTSLTDNLYLPVYTHNNVFIPRGFLSIVPADEAIERFLLIYKIADIPEERIKNMFSLTKNNQELRQKKRFNFDDCAGLHLFFRRYIGSDYYNCSVPDDQLALILSTYEKLDTDLKQWRKKYRIDYWLWGPNEKQWAGVNPDQIDNWQLVWENQDYTIYKIND